MAKSSPKPEPGAKQRFEHVVDYMLKTPPKPHDSAGKKKRKAKAKRKASAP